MTSESLQYFDGPLGCLTSQKTAALAAQLAAVPGLDPDGAQHIHGAAMRTLHRQLNRKLARTLLVELNGMRVQGQLAGDTPKARWDDFLAQASRDEFWSDIQPHYPALRGRVDRLIDNSLGAALTFAHRWAADREALTPLLGAAAGALMDVSFGAGDTHCGGQTVAMIDCEAGRIFYKPRPVHIDVALRHFVARLEEDCGRPLWMRVPAVVDRGDYGWAASVAHRYADGDELSRFYQGIGHWLAVMRVVGGVDFHAENLIACGPAPAIIDCETLFAPRIPPIASGYGDAVDKATQYVSGTVLATGLLPNRGKGLGWRGVDVSGIGALPGQQPTMMLPDIIDAGTDTARIGMRAVPKAPTLNHPSADPSLADHWPNVLEGFSMLSGKLRAMDAQGTLRPRLAPFEDCRVRVITRATEIYAELMRMLWHPASLHDEAAARARGADLLAKMAANVAMAPSDPAVIAAEIGDLAIGDVPYFAGRAGDGVLDGPGGTHWMAPRNLVEEAYARWRDADLKAEEAHMRAALVSAYMTDGWMPPGEPTRPAVNRLGDLDRRRRAQAAAVMRQLTETAIRGRDGTITWIAPTLLMTGWTVQAVTADLYNGTSGIAVLAAAYQREVRAGRADAVAGVDTLLTSLLKTLDCFAAKHANNMRKGLALRPQPPGAYLGLGSQIWAQLLLERLGVGGSLAHAETLAQQLPAAIEADEVRDVLRGRPGAIPALLALHTRTSDAAWLAMARTTADDMCASATRDGDRAWWTHERWPNGLGGFAHGVTGVGWALSRLAQATGEDRYRDTARAAFAFEDTLFDADEQNWIDLRAIAGAPKAANAWCHGAVGIGLAHLDIDPALTNARSERTVSRAAKKAWTAGIGWNHCACHGDMGALELLDRAVAAGAGPRGVTRDAALSLILTSLEDYGPTCGVLKDAFVPGLMTGVGGIAWQLLRMAPDSRLPSLLTLDDPAMVSTEREPVVVGA
jgi:type 2 lantibiotic biosynthesis protein LanM